MGGISHATTISTARAGLIRPRSLLRAHRDERLVAQLRAGNEHAFEALFDRYRPRLLAFCRGMLHSSEDAEDILQEVFTAAHSAILADDRAIDVRPWLYRIARNRCLNHKRHPQPEARESLDEHPHENGTTTEDRAERREDLRHLVENIRELPETQRSALLMRELEALSYGEIASSLDTTVPAVKSLLVRARVSLAEASQANELSCSQVRFELAAAAEGIGKASGPVRHHVRRCSDCTAYRSHLRSTARGLAALAPVGPLLLLKRLIGAKLSGAGGGSGAAGGAGSGGAGAGVAGGTGTAGAGTAGAAAVGGAGLIGSKAATGAAVVALVGAGGAAVTVTEPELPSPASIVTAVGADGGAKAVDEPGDGPHRADSGASPSEPGGTGSAGGSGDPADADDPDRGETGEGHEPADETAEDDTATEGESSDDAPGADPGSDYDGGGASDDDSLLAARRERLRQLLARDRAAAHRWWLTHRDQHTGGNPSPSPPQPPQPDPPPPDEDPPADDPPHSPDGSPPSEKPGGEPG